MALPNGRALWAVLLSVMTTLGVLFIRPPIASAASIAVSPVNISLTRDNRSALLLITNEGAETVRFSLSVFGWEQSDTGKIELTPTSDIIFFPSLLTLAPGEQRNVRLGTQLVPGDVERSYRIFLEELPSPRTARVGRGLAIRMLSKIGIPIFVVPDKPKTQADIEAISLHKGTLSFRVENTGTVHILPGPASVEGSSAADNVVFNKEFGIWYILAGGRRTLSMPLPAGTCAKIRSITISVKIGTTTVRRSQPTSSGACAS